MSSDSEIDVVCLPTEEPTTSSRKRKTYLHWIVEAWNGITKDAMIKSFKVCGITNAADGTEDNEINCFKPDGPVPNGRELLRQARIDK
ncbi:hypothetical protein ACQ4LE_007554 [Meloidogyne hapla]